MTATAAFVIEAIHQAPEKFWSDFAPQHHKLRISSPEFTDSADTHAPERTFAIVFGNQAYQKRLDSA